ncbi:sugar phosphate nucleotidyltransferase [Paenibacillus daejeonensis]|uniref:sugar phosphate nucleotidyltransferase n=1 Tax=Paenibacillus daejeonensis TaxID=135193 RepID=UPI00036C9C13|nr:sugar phosphate nucleotidyltransferase [Paenibacillus daejeonensis]
MKLVLLSGGSGKRLWPLSNDARSKQFLKVLENDKGQMESMVQRVWGQIRAAGLDQEAVIATSKLQVDIMQNQLGDVPIVAEPERRDTFPAIALAASYLYSVQGVGLDETVCILPVDPYVEDHFFERIKALETSLHQSGANLALMGVKPTYPSSKYGYIVPGGQGETEDYRTVSRFTEKPTEAKAQALIAEDALWNCGVFAFKLEYIITKLMAKGWPVQYEELSQQYQDLPKISFDYEVVEKEEKIVAIDYDGYWKDLGTWNTLTENMGVQQMGNGAICEDSHNTHLINELDIPVTVIGISDAVVAVSPDGILVADKQASPKIKDMVLPGQMPMYEERTWGWYRVLDYAKYEDADEVLTKRIGLKPGKHLNYQKYSLRADTWTIISGEGQLVRGQEIISVKAGDVFHIPANEYHAIKAVTDMEMIEIQKGSILDCVEEAMEHVQSWEDLEDLCGSGRMPS